ncbi:hypothetical protein DEAC_c40040 [Desulfosporosinus acididurans]|uniref:DUF2634 domain-containing protein n=1 Tax=Desulfosporosinus acididurans TaxID=476652 RepID=A0A0J1FKM0_9FIRM|nr:DUF2634 domain-containing protein [Desulfosporosinus acididurans]KLU64010.1 hypothetical protein DEAC_c40040 [Desulfosporosinus acididurans]
MSIFPDNIGQAVLSSSSTTTTLPLAKEYAWDYINNDFLLVDGKNVVVTGQDAVKVWIWKALQTPKNRYKAYSGSFGNDLESLIATGFSPAALSSEVERYLKESLLINPYITGIADISLSTDGSKANVSFTATTIYGEVSLSV